MVRIYINKVNITYQNFGDCLVLRKFHIKRNDNNLLYTKWRYALDLLSLTRADRQQIVCFSRSCRTDLLLLTTFLYVRHMMCDWRNINSCWRVGLPQLPSTLVIVYLRSMCQSPVVNVVHVQRTEVHLGWQKLQCAFVVRATTKRWARSARAENWRRPHAGKHRLWTFHIAHSTNKTVWRWSWIVSWTCKLRGVFRWVLHTLLNCAHHIAVVLQQNVTGKPCNLYTKYYSQAGIKWTNSMAVCSVPASALNAIILA